MERYRNKESGKIEYLVQMREAPKYVTAISELLSLLGADVKSGDEYCFRVKLPRDTVRKRRKVIEGILRSLEKL